jgi:Spy/CpxP family protein refolding chaperone
MKKLSLLAALVIVFASATLVSADPGRHHKKGNPEWSMDNNMLSELDLTAEQAESIRALRASFQEHISPLRTQVFEKKAEVRLMWMQTKTDADAIRTKEKQIHDLKWQINEKTTDFRLAVRKVLTPEQLTRFLALGGERRHHRAMQLRDRNCGGPGEGSGGPGKGMRQSR